MSLRTTAYYLWHGLKRDGVNRATTELLQNQWMSPDELTRQQHQKLRDLLDYVAVNVPYYSGLLRETSSSDVQSDPLGVLGRMPRLDKDTIRRHLDDLISQDLSDNAIEPNSTSGSTGEALRFFTDRRSEPYRKAAETRSDMFAGWKFGEPVVRLWGAAMDQSVASSLRGKVHGWMTANRFLSSFDLSTNRMDEYIEVMRSAKPRLLVGYPGPLEAFAAHCRERGAVFPGLHGIVSSAERLWPHQRDSIEGAFKVRVYDRYGCREVGQIASECERQDGLHVSVDRLVVEIVDDNFAPCEPGTEGRILVTDLDNYGMPMLRYDIGDRGTIDVRGPCTCGRGLPLLRNIGGRTLDVVLTAGGQRIGGTFWTLLLRSKPGIRQFQVVQDALSGVRIRYVADSDLEQSALAWFDERIREQCGADFVVKFERETKIDLPASGKHRLVVSALDTANDGD